MRIVIAPDSFKGSLPAKHVADAIAAGWREIRPDDDIVCCPQADGGEGTMAAIGTGGRTVIVPDVTGPDGQLVTGEYVVLPDGTAVIEMAQMSGLAVMENLDAAGATSRGLGEVIRAALDAGAQRLHIGLGGSASTDGGAGALAALGLVLLDSDDEPLPDGGEALSWLFGIDDSEMVAAPEGGVELLTDVTAPLLGASGAAAVFGPQKGADPELVEVLDIALNNFAHFLTTHGAASDAFDGDYSKADFAANGGSENDSSDGARADSSLQGLGLAVIPGAGAAGGTAFGLMMWAGAAGRLVPGAARVAELTGLGAQLEGADLIITGEGRFDDTSLTGKVIGNLLTLVDPSTVIIIAGQVAARIPRGVRGVCVSDLAGSSEASIADPVRWLTEAGRSAARLMGSKV
ncbi:glycerate kinase [Nakamurella antarctica]|uniref:Glycerate kinase n=1 Tax=Nakamurella antarctica TaxID=1902245 RepID=A0A3G8ZYP4_9ACTN|nr:glycerate kinase [Nakamurella antarctica]AZI59146.1 glycerate kinase [Nakamurella antarctica]